MRRHNEAWLRFGANHREWHGVREFPLGDATLATGLVYTACIRFRDPRLIVAFEQELEPTLDQNDRFLPYGNRWGDDLNFHQRKIGLSIAINLAGFGSTSKVRFFCFCSPVGLWSRRLLVHISTGRPPSGFKRLSFFIENALFIVASKHRGP